VCCPALLSGAAVRRCCPALLSDYKLNCNVATGFSTVLQYQISSKLCSLFARCRKQTDIFSPPVCDRAKHELSAEGDVNDIKNIQSIENWR
jgi:hypothetical protein